MPAILEETETKWLSTLTLHCKTLFSGVFLPSHNHLHHSRVWSHARELILLLERSGIKIRESLPEELIIAVFFHDVGLSRTPGERHGAESRKLCKEFFDSQASVPVPPEEDSLERILHAVEHHDDKSIKKSAARIEPGAVPDLLSLLSAADDLDAFGLMGIYRYAEIYLLRGIRPEQLPGLVCANVQNRYNNLQNTFGTLKEFIDTRESRFRQVYDFYLRLAQGYASPDEKPCREILLLGIIQDAVLRGQNLLERDRVLQGTDLRAELSDWFRELDAENPVT